MPRRGTAAVLLALLTAGCTATTTRAQPTAEARPASTTPTPSPVAASSVASPSATSERIQVGTADVAGVAVGTSADEAERRLTEVLGRPLTNALPGCYGESGRSLTWDALTAFLSDGAELGAVVLRGWLVTSGANSQRMALPYDTAVGQTAAEVLSKVPAAEGATATEGPYTGSFLVTTGEAPGLLWRSAGKSGVVDEVAYEAEGCD